MRTGEASSARRWQGVLLGCTLLFGACGLAGGDLTGGVSTAGAGPGSGPVLGDGTPVPADPPMPDACTDVTLGDPMTCNDAGTWKETATKYCAAKKEQVGGLSLSTECGMGMFRTAKFQCCPASPPPPMTCFSGDLGDGKSCIDPGTLKMEAAQLCAEKMAQLTDLKPSDPCMGGYAQATYTCCIPMGPPPPPPPPPPGMCFSGDLGDGKTCLDPGTLKMEAEAQCEMKMAQLADLKPEDPCMGGFTRASFTCCVPMGPPPPPPPPPPGGMCFGGTLGEDGSTCQDGASWEVEVANLCAAAKMRVDHLSLSNDCGKGQFSYAEYQCCP